MLIVDLITNNLGMSCIRSDKGGTLTPSIKDGVITFKQYAYEITKYDSTLWFKGIADVTISFLRNKKWEQLKFVGEGEYNKYNWQFLLDFNKPYEQLKIASINDLFEPVIFKCQYIWADKEKYLRRLADEAKAAFEKVSRNINLKAIDGNALINIYWDVLDKDIDKVVLTISYKEHVIEKLDLSPNITFKSIGGLAYGMYAVNVKQYSKNKLIGEQTVYPKIKEPGAKPTIHN